MSNKHLIGSLVLCIWIFLASAVVLAQVTSRVTGVVRDPQGSVVSGATVTLTNEGTGIPFTMTTTSAGTYVFDAVQPGTYTVRVESPGSRNLLRLEMC